MRVSVSVPAALYCFGQRAFEVLGRAGLFQDRMKQRDRFVVAGRGGGQGDDGCVAELGVIAQQTRDIDATVFRHVQIGEHHVGPMLRGELERGIPIGGFDDFI